MPRILLPKEVAWHWCLDTNSNGLPVLKNGAVCLLAVTNEELPQEPSNWRWGVPTHVLAYFEQSAHPWVVWGLTYDGCHHGAYFLDYRSAHERLWRDTSSEHIPARWEKAAPPEHTPNEEVEAMYKECVETQITPKERREAMQQRVIYTTKNPERTGQIGTAFEHDDGAPLRPGVVVEWSDGSKEPVRASVLSPAKASSYSMWVEERVWNPDGDTEEVKYLTVELRDGTSVMYVFDEDRGWQMHTVASFELPFLGDHMEAHELEQLHQLPGELESDECSVSIHNPVTRAWAHDFGGSND